MTLEALASAELPSFLVYDTISATPLLHHTDPSSSSSILFDNAGMMGGFPAAGKATPRPSTASTAAAAGQGKRKRRRTRTTTCKNKEEAENQRMTHIAVERNRRRQMNEHLAVLRSLMPESYIQRGDQASIVGGAIDFVKELEQLLQSLEAQKRALQQQADAGRRRRRSSSSSSASSSSSNSHNNGADSPPFSDFFSFPQYSWCHTNQDQAQPEAQPPALADIEVTLIETHANVRILSPKRPGQLFKMMAGIQNLRLTVLHLNVTSLDSMALYSLSLKVEEGCGLSSVDDIAAAIHQMLSLIEAEVTAAAAAAAAMAQ